MTACLFGAHSSFPPMHVCVLTDTQHDYFCTLPLRFPSTQANYPASIQQTVAAAASLLAAEVGVDSVLLPWALPVSLAGARMGGFVTCVFVSLVGFPPLHPYGWREQHANIIGRLEGWFIPRSLCLMQLPWRDLRELCWGASKVKILCERMVQSIRDVILVFM